METQTVSSHGQTPDHEEKKETICDAGGEKRDQKRIDQSMTK